MIDSTQPGLRLPKVIFFLIAVGFTAESGDAQDNIAVTTNWAVIAADAKAGGLADLLTAELSDQPGVQLVEREQIDRVLSELRLQASGLAEGHRAAKFGKLSKAHALVLINLSSEGSGKPMLRIRLIDTRTSVRLLDTIVLDAKLDEQIAAVRAELLLASRPLSVSDQQLRLISVMPIVSLEPSVPMLSECVTLTTLLSAEFHRLPQFVVLEREDLQRLTAESRLSGLELRLRGATRLLETSIRRNEDNTGMIASCRMATPDGSEPQVFDVRSETKELAELRSAIVAEVARRAGTDSKPYRPETLEREAERFDLRARQYQRAYRPLDTFRMAEAAYTLAPNRDRYRNFMGHMSRAISVHAKNKDWLKALRLGRRHQQLTLDELKEKGSLTTRFLVRIPIDEFKQRYPPRGPIGYGHYSPPLRATTPEEQQLLTEIYQLRRRNVDETIRQLNGHPVQTFVCMMKKYDLLLSHELPGADCVQEVTRMLGPVYLWADKSKIQRDVRDPFYRAIFSKMMATVRQLEGVKYSRSVKPGWKSTDPEIWFMRLNDLDPLAGKIAWLKFQARDHGSEGLQAARELLAELKDLPLELSDEAHYFDFRIRGAGVFRLSADERKKYFLDLLAESNNSGDPTQVVLHSYTLTTYLRRLPQAEHEEIGQRVGALLSGDHPASKLRAWQSLKNEATRYSRMEAASQSFRAKLRAPEFSLDDAPGAWKDYVARPIRLKPPGRAYNILRVQHDNSQEAKGRGGEVIVCWALPYKKARLERLDLSTGKQTPIGGPFEGAYQSFREYPMVIAPDAIYFSSEPPGLVKVTSDQVKTFTKADGLPSDDIWSLAWWDDRLYVGYRDALGTFDPKAETFELFASSLSAEPRNPIDGQGGFFPRTLIPDRSSGSIWMNIQDNAVRGNRHGLWRFEPDKHLFHRVTKTHARVFAGFGDVLIIDNQEPLVSWIQQGSKQRVALPQFAHLSTRTSPLVRWGDHIISQRGVLFTADGKSVSAEDKDRWQLFQTVGNAVVTRYDPHKKTLWLIERK